MKKIFALTVIIAMPCLANFDGYYQRSFSKTSYLKTQFTSSDTAAFHIGCGSNTVGQPFSIIVVKHPSFYQSHRRFNILLSVDDSKEYILDGATKQYEDMYYSKHNPPEELFTEIRKGHTLQVKFLENQKLIFALKGSNRAYQQLWEECGLL
ncbi:hypothetical protein [Vibrio sp. CAU 1672]|uniref:hypothetical protein n=1 Tax=Vibrio sp. CAU 1672 TaxID=3032594 RepID=UPI0023DA1A34|nr:hypothetical protein [Vibrio sp. CAU 1672]MDF2152881.1 hypothetical protein [Vibrio sp. CAU 1672]